MRALLAASTCFDGKGGDEAIAAFEQIPDAFEGVSWNEVRSLAPASSG